MGTHDVELMGHLMRRAGFGAGYEELEARAAKGYEATVDELIATDSQEGIDDLLLYRYHPDHQGGLGMAGAAAYWLYRMVNTEGPLHEKVSLFWHSVFATGYQKVTQGRGMMNQIAMFREHGMGSFRDLLVEISKDPCMVLWLDNNENHAGAVNENYGRELLELFSMGVGNYTEQDVKECARAFTGWTTANIDYVAMKAQRDSLWPYGRMSMRFEYREDDHDGGEKEFLGHTGSFDGQDVVDMICAQPATARFIARHMYHFFVADEPPVPQWSLHPPADPEAIDILAEAYFEHDYRIDEMLRVLFKSDFFRARSSWFRKVKGPAELVAGLLRLTGRYRMPDPRLQGDANLLTFMGQTLINPPSVEGWHQGTEWIDTGTAVERINYAVQQLSDPGLPGVRQLVGSVVSASGNGDATAESLVQACLDHMGAISVKESTRDALVEFAAERGTGEGGGTTENVAELVELVAATPDFQRE